MRANRYGFNGKENDNEVKGIEGSQQDYGFRIYDPRLGKFLSVDPLTKKYAHYTPYQFSGNKPIKFIDLDGAEEFDPSFKPTGIAHMRVAKVPDGEETKSVRLGNYEMRGFISSNGSSYWIARYHHTEGDKAGLHQDEWVVGVDAFAEFAKDTKGRHNLSTWIFEYGNNLSFKQALKETFKEGWRPRNVVNGALMLAGASVALSSARNSIRPIARSSGEDMVTLYRSISKEEAESIAKTGKLSLGPGMEVKQFWQTKEGLDAWNNLPLAGEFNLEITVPKSLLGKGKPLNTAVQVDEFVGPNATIDRSQIGVVNQNLKSVNITPVKKQ